jgi:two-component system, LytTR family, response regulator AlgR
MKVLIADDEPLARVRLRRLLEGCEPWQCVGEAGDAETTLEACSRLAPDAVLLDIALPGPDGLAVARALRSRTPAPAVIFVTAHSEHALGAFDLGAAHYLLKPITRERLVEALGRVSAVRGAPTPAPGPGAHVRVLLRGKVHWVPVSEVRYFEADQKYVTAHAAEREYLIEESLVRLEARLGTEFARVHRKLLVNLAYVSALERGAAGRLQILLADGRRLPVSRRCTGVVRERAAGEAARN